MPSLSTKRRICFEPLEARCLLSVMAVTLAATETQAVAAQPAGALSGKIVYTSGGHGWTADNLDDGAWSTQRGEWHEIVEDFGNQDQMTLYVDYLFRAGATVVPMRPVGHQTNEVVLDNDDPGVTFVGNWSTSSSSVYFGNPGDVPYRFANASSTQTAYARYRPTIPETGYYPVYAWTLAGGNRASDQLYRVTHSGGVNEVTVNHRAVGGGYVYLGTYYFEAGNAGYVDVSNRSGDAGVAIIADAIRFGNGRGDIDRGGGVSGAPREDEAALYWIMAQVGQGTSSSEYRDFSSDRSSTIRAPILWAEHMNREAEGSAADRVYLGFHSNGSNGSARGTMGLYNSGSGSNTATPHQQAWAAMVADALNDDMQVIGSPPLEHPWHTRSSPVYGASYGEIDNRVIQNEFDATIVEIAFHDNEQDARLMRDPEFRDAAARSMYQATVEYFAAYGSVATETLLPEPVTNVRAAATTDGRVTVSWEGPAANVVGSDPPTGYRIYRSTNGYGFDGGVYVGGQATTSYTFTDLDPADGVVYFRVVAVNDGGESAASELVAARPGTSPDARVLIVNGFDRLDRTLNPTQSYGSGTIERVRPRWSNSFDYAAQMGAALAPYSEKLVIDTASNEAVAGGQVDLDSYQAVFWILGEESTADATFDPTEQTVASLYIAQGGNLFVSGAEIGWDLDHYNHGRTFFRNILGATYVADDANTYRAAGTPGSIFEGIALTFDDGTTFYNTDYPDVLTPSGGSSTALSYVGGTGGTAAVQREGDGAQGNVVLCGFPFETITDPAVRQTMMNRVLTFFDTAPEGPVGDLNGDGFVGGDDLDLVRAHWGQHVTPGNPLQGDPSGDGFVGSDDLNLVRAHWGEGVPPVPTTDFTAPAETPLAEVFRAQAVDLAMAERYWRETVPAHARRMAGRWTPTSPQAATAFFLVGQMNSEPDSSGETRLVGPILDPLRIGF